MANYNGFSSRTEQHQPRRQRRWDDPPEEPPSLSSLQTETLELIKLSQTPSKIETEITQLSFTPDDYCVVGIISTKENMYPADYKVARTLNFWSATSGEKIPLDASGTSYTPYVDRGYALTTSDSPSNPYAAYDMDVVAACPSNQFQSSAPYRIDILRLQGCQVGSPLFQSEGAPSMLRIAADREAKLDVPCRGPVAWSSDGTMLAATDMKDPSKVLVLRTTGNIARLPERVLMGHMDEVTQLAFLSPISASDGEWAQPRMVRLVTAGRDGYVRVTDVENNRTLGRISVTGSKASRGPSILCVSPYENMVVTVWDRDVVIWHLERSGGGPGIVETYDLDSVRPTEGWPLAVSPDCRYLVCRTETGFDVSDLLTGKILGSHVWDGLPRSPITSAAFKSDGTKLAVSDYVGRLAIFELVDLTNS